MGPKGSARVLSTTLPTLPNDMVSLVCADLRFECLGIKHFCVLHFLRLSALGMLSAQFQVVHGVSLDEAPPSVSRVNFGFRMLGEDCFHFPSSSYICSPLFQASPLLLNLSPTPNR